MKLNTVAFHSFTSHLWALCGIMWEYFRKIYVQSYFAKRVNKNSFSFIEKAPREAKTPKTTSLVQLSSAKGGLKT
jgi:hypothetical protein